MRSRLEGIAMLQRRSLVGLGLAALIGVALVAEADPDPKDLARELSSAVAAQDPDKVQRALAGLLKSGGAEALEAVTDRVQKTAGRGSPTIYWQLVKGAAGFRDPEALDALGEFLVKKKKAPLAADLLFGLGCSSSPEAVRALGRVLGEKKAYHLQLMAADQLARFQTRASVTALANQLEAEGSRGDPELRRRIRSALSTVTGRNPGAEDADWLKWWKQDGASWKPPAAQEGDRKEGDEGRLSANLSPDRLAELRALQQGPSRVLVISSKLPADYPKRGAAGRSFDEGHLEQILEWLKIPHKVILKIDFEREPDKYLKGAWTILVNCNTIQTQCLCRQCDKILAEKAAKGQSLGPKNNRLLGCPPECPSHDQVSFRMRRETVDKLQKWVEAGGYLLTEDWGLIEILEVAWPKRLRSDTKHDAAGKGTTAQVPAMRVEIMPGQRLASRPLLRGAFGTSFVPVREGQGPAKPAGWPSWTIAEGSPSLVVGGKGVDVLLRSEALGKAMSGADAIAVSFRVGKAKRKKSRRGAKAGRSRGKGPWSELKPGGCVLHFLSHFGKQEGASKETFVLQNLVLNFVAESSRQHGE
jgi:hypothetical protein